MSKSKLESTFAWQLANLGYLPYSPDNPDGYQREHRFHPQRKWRLDFYFHKPRPVAVEIEGGLYKPNSGHRSFWGVRRGIEKSNHCQLAGILLLRFSPEEVNTGSGVRMLDRLLKGK